MNGRDKPVDELAPWDLIAAYPETHSMAIEMLADWCLDNPGDAAALIPFEERSIPVVNCVREMVRHKRRPELAIKQGLAAFRRAQLRELLERCERAQAGALSRAEKLRSRDHGGETPEKVAMRAAIRVFMRFGSPEDI